MPTSAESSGARRRRPRQPYRALHADQQRPDMAGAVTLARFHAPPKNLFRVLPHCTTMRYRPLLHNAAFPGAGSRRERQVQPNRNVVNGSEPILTLIRPHAGRAVPGGCLQVEPLSEGRPVVMRVQVRSADLQVSGSRATRLARLCEAMPLSNELEGIDLRSEPEVAVATDYPAFAAAAGPGRCSADSTRRIITCLMPSMRKPARFMRLNAACTSGLASWRLMTWGWVTW
jgi:hypothetical protein